MGDTEDLDEMIKMSQVDLDVLNSDMLSKVEKIRTIVRFNKAKKSNPNLSQSALCKSIGTTVATIERIRKDLNVPSPYRYSVSTKTEAQKEKAKYRQKVYSAFKSGAIDEYMKSSLYDRINSSLDKSVKDDVSKLKSSINRSKISKVTPRGGGLKAADSDDDEPRTITEEEAQRRMKGITQGDAEKLAEKYLKDM
jgi:hypothetical protein